MSVNGSSFKGLVSRGLAAFECKTICLHCGVDVIGRQFGDDLGPLCAQLVYVFVVIRALMDQNVVENIFFGFYLINY